MAQPVKNEITDDQGPDLGERLVIWYEENQRLVTILLVALIVVILGWKGWQVMKTRKAEKSSAEYTMLLENLSRGMNEQDEAKRKDAMRAAITEAERLSSAFAGTYVGHMSQLMLGNAHFYMAAMVRGQEAQQELTAARTAYQQYNELGNLDPRDRAVGRLAMGNLLEDLLVRTRDRNLGKEAIEAYKDAQRLAPGTFIDAEAKLGEARIYRNSTGKENAEKAAALLQQVQETWKVETTSTRNAERDRTFVNKAGRAFTAEELQSLINFEQFSMKEYASDLQRQFSGLPTEVPQPPADAATTGSATSRADATTTAGR